MRDQAISQGVERVILFLGLIIFNHSDCRIFFGNISRIYKSFFFFLKEKKKPRYSFRMNVFRFVQIYPCLHKTSRRAPKLLRLEVLESRTQREMFKKDFRCCFVCFEEFVYGPNGEIWFSNRISQNRSRNRSWKPLEDQIL